MRVIVFGATGMVGRGTLRVCLLAADVEEVLCIGRRPTGQSHAKLRELVRDDLREYADLGASIAGYDACFFCLGVTSAGMNEADYRRVTRDIPAAAGAALARQNPDMTFVLVSGAGTDSTERGRVMWARVKGEAENAIFALPFRGAYAFRPGMIQAKHGITSRTASYRYLYAVLAPAIFLGRAFFPNHVTSTEQIGRAMLNVARRGYPKRILESKDIEAAANLPA